MEAYREKQDAKLAALQAEKEEQETKFAEEALRIKEADEAKKAEREQLQKEIEELRKQLEEANSTVVTLTQKVNEKPEVQVVYEKVITGKGMTKEEVETKLALLKQRLKANEKELSSNKKDYLPLKRVALTLANDEKKLRRKEAMVAKKKVMLYGVNNYVDIDEEKAKELAEELDLLEGLKLSVQHCHEVMEANRDRYPILEKANKILTNNIEGLKADIEELEKQLAEFPTDDSDSDEGKKEVAIEEPVKEVEQPAKEEKEPEVKDVVIEPVVEPVVETSAQEVETPVEEKPEEPVVESVEEPAQEEPVAETPVEEKVEPKEEVKEEPKEKAKPTTRRIPLKRPGAKKAEAKKVESKKSKKDDDDIFGDDMADADVEALVNAILGTSDKK